jgi:hypothetical protein
LIAVPECDRSGIAVLHENGNTRFLRQPKGASWFPRSVPVTSAYG